MISLGTSIKCGTCKTEYHPFFYCNCPQCGAGMQSTIYTTSTLNHDYLIYDKAK